jgi:hypothetical protein
VAVHDIAMQLIGMRGFAALDFIGKMKKIGGENGWGNADETVHEVLREKEVKS